MFINFIQNSTDSIKNINVNNFSNSFWFWATIIEFFVILILKYYKRSSDSKFKRFSREKIKDAQKAEIDMDNLMMSINGARKLYKELSKICHPDRFLDLEKKTLAEKIFQEITDNKRNYGKLSELKLRAENELNIKF